MSCAPKMSLTETKILIAAISAEEERRTLAVISRTDEDILTDDYSEDRRIPYHLVPPTREWLKSRILWGKSVLGELDAYADCIAEYLVHIDHNMLVCLNRICIISEEEDIEPLCSAMDTDTDEFPECIDFEELDILGCKWHSQNSIIINTAANKKAASELVDSDPDYFILDNEIATAFWTTLLHEIRHLGLECNPFLPEGEYPVSLQSEAEVESWTLEQYEFL